jgi:hypothetical protein
LGGHQKNVCPYVRMFVIPQMSRDHARQKHLAKAATAAPRRGEKPETFIHGKSW